MRGIGCTIAISRRSGAGEGAGSPRSNTGGHAPHAHGRKRPSRPRAGRITWWRCATRPPVGLAGSSYPGAVPGGRRALATPGGRAGPAGTVRMLCAEGDPGRLTERLREAGAGMTLTRDPTGLFDPATAPRRPVPPLRITTLTGFGFEDNQRAWFAAGALRFTLQETLKASLAHLSRLRPYRQQPFPFPRRSHAPQPGADPHPA